MIGALIKRIMKGQDNGRGDLPEIHVTRNGSFFMKGHELAHSETWRKKFKGMVEANLARPNTGEKPLKRHRTRAQGRTRYRHR